MNRDNLDAGCRKGAFGLILATLVFAPLAWGAVRPSEFLVVLWLTLGVLMLWGLRLVLRPQTAVIWPTACWWVLAFAAYAVMRHSIADVPHLSRQEMVWVLVYGALFAALLNHLEESAGGLRVAAVVIAVALGVALYAVGQYLSESPYAWHQLKPEGYWKRGSGPFICPNHTAGYLGMVLPPALALLLLGRLPHVTRIVLGYAVLALGAGLAVTVSRGGWAATGLALVAMLLTLAAQRGFLTRGLTVLLALLALAAALYFKAGLSRNGYEPVSLSTSGDDYRLQLWRPAVQMWRDHFWLGVGPGHFDTRFRQYRPETPILQGRPERVHNDYLNAVVDWGLVGGLLVAGALTTVGLGLRRSWDEIRRQLGSPNALSNNRAVLVFGASFGLLAIALHSLVDFNLHIPSNALLAITLMGLVVHQTQEGRPVEPRGTRGPARAAAIALLGMATVLLTGHALKQSAEVYWLSRAERADDPTPWLEKAARANPGNFETCLRLGEVLRERSWSGPEEDHALAERALDWFRRAALLNPYDPAGRLGAGMCLDWLGRHEEAEREFAEALRLDPHGYYTLARIGWHHVQRRDYTTAIQWLQRSLALRGSGNAVAATYLELARRRLAEGSSPTNLPPVSR
ncbi:MAG TPA: O-antigen ligase family protein [Methylomirabilota bacterium]|nr:O-antigen ligase family protein [Methylomirabilota bacterium]